MRLARSFYDRPTLDVARDLCGKILVHRRGRSHLEGRIVETEAYRGPEDRACHASRGRTKRTELLFGPPGFAYVYLIYGMYYCLNAVTEKEGFPAAVLIRALEVTGKRPVASMSGPGRLCRALHIDLRLNGADFTGDTLFVEDRGESVGTIGTSPRIGVDYAGEWAQKPWRFFIEGSPAVSRARPVRRSA
jgi:DNA-3-methyladenine glycosylase